MSHAQSAQKNTLRSLLNQLGCVVMGGALFVAPLTLSPKSLSAEEAEFAVAFPMLTWKSSSKEVEPKVGKSTTTNSTKFSTVPLSGASLKGSFGHFTFAFNRFSGRGALSGGYLLNKFLEVGLDLGLKRDSVKSPLTKSSEYLYGAYLSLTPKMGKASLTLDFIFDYTSKASETTTTAVAGKTTLSLDDILKDFPQGALNKQPLSLASTTKKTDESETMIKVAATIDFPLRKNLSYSGGLSYTMTSTVDNESKDRTSTGDFGEIGRASCRERV